MDDPPNGLAPADEPPPNGFAEPEPPKAGAAATGDLLVSKGLMGSGVGGCSSAFD